MSSISYKSPLTQDNLDDIHFYFFFFCATETQNILGNIHLRVTTSNLIQRWSTIPQISTTRIASSPQTTALKTDPHMELEIHVLTWYKHKNMTELYRLLGSKPSHSCNWISNDNADKNKQLNTQKDHIFKTWLSQLYGPIWIKQIIGISSRSWRFRITMNFQ